MLPPHFRGQSPSDQRFFLDTTSPVRFRPKGGNAIIPVVMADGSIREMSASIDPEVIERLGEQIVGGHVPGLPGSAFEGARGLDSLIDSLPEERRTRAYTQPVDPEEAALALEAVQIGLDVIGIFDPTGAADITSGTLALSQGNLYQAGFSFAGVFSLLEPAKVVAKLPRIAQFVDKVIDFAKRSPAAAERAVGWLRVLADGLDSVKGSLPQSVWDQLAPIRKKVDDFLAPRRVPSVRGGEFQSWFNRLSPDELDEIWKNQKLRDAIEDRLRNPGGLHEWHLVARTPTFKRWGLTAEQIKDMRTLIDDTKFVNPVGRHGGKGSTLAHNELLEIIDSSTNYVQFVRRLQNWAVYRLKGGVDALPYNLRPQ